MSLANLVLSQAQRSAGADQVAGFSVAKNRAITPGGIAVKLSPDLEINPGSVAIDHSAARGVWVFTTANAGESIAQDNTVLFDGEPSMKFTLPTVQAVSVAKFTPTNPISLKNFFAITLAVKVPIADSVYNIGHQSGGPIQYWLVTSTAKQIRLRMRMDGVEPDGTKIFRWTRDQPGSTYDVSPGGTTWADLDASTIANIQIVYYGNLATSAAPAGTAFWVSPLRINTAARPIVSLRFDHGYAGVHTHIKAALKASNLYGTIYAIHSRLGTAGYMSLTQMDEMYADGHEIGLHHFDAKTAVGYGTGTTDWPTSASITDDINSAWAVNRARGWNRGVGLICEGFSGNYYGGSTNAARQQLVRQGIQAAGVRNMCALNAGWPMLNDPVPWHGNKRKLIYATVSIGATTTPAQVNAAIDSAIAYKQWLIILMHDIVADAATPSGNEMRVSDALTWIAYLSSKVQSGACIGLPVGDVLDLIG